MSIGFGITLFLLLLCHQVFSDSLATPWTVACKAPLSMEFSKQEYLSRLPFTSPGDLPDLRIEPSFPALAADSFPLSHQGSLRLLRLCVHVSVLLVQQFYTANFLELNFPYLQNGYKFTSIIELCEGICGEISYENIMYAN